MTSNDPSEHSEQAALFKWAAWARNSPGIPRIKVGGAAMSALDFLHAVPNGGYRTPATAAVLKAEGVKAGVPDLCLPYPCGGYHGLYIEMKRRKYGRVSPEQRTWLSYLRSQCYAVAVCRGWEEARDMIIAYLQSTAN